MYMAWAHFSVYLRVVCAVTFFLFVMGGCSQLSPEAEKAEHYKRGMAYFEKGQYQEAVIELKNVIQLDPKDADAHYQLALIHMKLGGLSNMQNAFGELTKTVELDPSIQDAQLKLGDFFLLGGDPQKARQKAEIILASSPQNPKGHLLRGRSLLIQKEFEEGISELKKSLALDPENVQIYIDLARAYVGLKKPKVAEETLRKGLLKTPNSP